MLAIQRKRTSTELIMYALYSYFLGLSFRSTAKALDPFVEKRTMLLYGTGYNDSNQAIYI